MAQVEYDVHKIPTITLSVVEREELDKTGYVQVEDNLFVIFTADERIVTAKTIPFNTIKFKFKEER